jgi:tetratricopeptide (TPR) repeat protein
MTYSDCPRFPCAYNENEAAGVDAASFERMMTSSPFAVMNLRRVPGRLWKSRIMPSESDRSADASSDAGCRLSTLRKRSQIDFEIDFFERILSRDPNYAEVLANLGDLFARKGCHRRALQVDLRLAQLRPRNSTVHYNLACSHAVLNHMTEAVAALDFAIDLGYDDLEHLLSDPDLEGVRRHVGFRRILAKLETAVSPTRIV